MLKTSCILLPRAEGENDTRISVMSRHTLNDGVMPDIRITSDLYDEYMPELAPPAKLMGDFYKRGLSWERFAEEYESYIRTIGGIVLQLANRSLESDITILCIETYPEFCHRRLLAERCKILIPELKIKIE